MRSALGTSRAQLGPLLLAAIPLAIGGGCGETSDPVSVSVAPSFTVPRALLDRATQVELRVFDGGSASCDEATGQLALGAGDAAPVASGTLGDVGCAENVRFCGALAVPKSSAPRVFEAKAVGDSGVVALGCSSALINQDAVPVAIKMVRFLAPAVCGDGELQPTEQCEPEGNDLCDDTCRSTEVRLSTGATANKTSNGKAGDKTDPFFVWPPGSGNDGRFVAFYSDRALPTEGGTLEVALRVLSPALLPASTPPALANGSIFLPNGGVFPPDATPRQQSLPRAAVLGGKYYVVFRDDNAPSLDIHLRVVSPLFEAESGTNAVGINGGATGEAGIQTAPAIAAGSDRLFVAWEDQASGAVVGRTLTPGTLRLGSQNQISTGNGNAAPSVAATSKGWVTAWSSDTGIKLRSVDTNGTPSGAEQTVNDAGGRATGGAVASLPDGRFAVVWSKDGDIFIQRYDARGIAIAGDQARALNDVVTTGEQSAPAITAMSAAGGSFAVAWHDASTGHVRARLVGGSTGYLFNNVNGQSTEFQASREDGHERSQPTIVAGGSGPFLAIGWQDATADNAGIFVRRFPFPID